MTGKDTIGNKPSHMGAWEKFQLGWLNYEVASAGQKSEHKLGPMEFNTKQAQGLFVVLPQKPVDRAHRRSVRGQLLLLQRLGEQPAQPDDQGVHSRRRRHTDRQGQLRHRGRLRLRQRDRLDRRRRHVADGARPTSRTRPSKPTASTDSPAAGWTSPPTSPRTPATCCSASDTTSDGGVNFDGFMIDDIEISGYPTRRRRDGRRLDVPLASE